LSPTGVCLSFFSDHRLASSIKVEGAASEELRSDLGRPTRTPRSVAFVKWAGRYLKPGATHSLLSFERTIRMDLKPLRRETRRYLFDQMQSLAWLDRYEFETRHDKEGTVIIRTTKRLSAIKNIEK